MISEINYGWMAGYEIGWLIGFILLAIIILMTVRILRKNKKPANK